MARVKYDVRGVEAGQRKVPSPNVYQAKITSADITKPEGKDERIELVVEVINDSDFNGAKLYEYVNLESDSAAWKLRELLEAAGVVGERKSSESGTLDTDKDLVGKIIGIKTFIRPADDARGFDEQARIRRMFPADGAAGSGESFDEEDTDVAATTEDEYDDMPLAKLKAELSERDLPTRGSKKALIERLRESDAEEQEDEEPEDEDGEEYTWEDVAELDKAELKQLITDEELGIKVLRSTDVDELRLEVAEALEIEDIPEDESEEDEEPEDEGDYSWDDINGLDRKGLRELIKEEELGIRVTPKSDLDAIKAKVAEALEVEVPAEDEAGDDDDQDDYEEWSLDDLKEELGQRSLSVKGTKRALVARLRKDDAEEDKPF
jgi:hypothetical protein